MPFYVVFHRDFKSIYSSWDEAKEIVLKNQGCIYRCFQREEEAKKCLEQSKEKTMPLKPRNQVDCVYLVGFSDHFKAYILKSDGTEEFVKGKMSSRLTPDTFLCELYALKKLLRIYSGNFYTRHRLTSVSLSRKIYPEICSEVSELLEKTGSKLEWTLASHHHECYLKAQ